MKLEKIDRRQVKHQAKALMSTNRKKFIMLNLPSIIMTILYFSVVYSLAYRVTASGSAAEVIQAGGLVTMTPRIEVIMMGTQLFMAMVQTGVRYTSLDYARNPKLEINPFSNAFQVFSGKYFIPVILMWLLADILVQAGMSLLIIPGIYLYLVLSQQYFIFKDGNSGEQKIGVISSMLNSGLVIKRFKWDLLILDISFIGWDILNVVTFGLLSFWLLPYKNLSYSVFYQRLIEAKRV